MDHEPNRNFGNPRRGYNRGGRQGPYNNQYRRNRDQAHPVRGARHQNNGNGDEDRRHRHGEHQRNFNNQNNGQQNYRQNAGRGRDRHNQYPAHRDEAQPARADDNPNFNTKMRRDNTKSLGFRALEEIIQNENGKDVILRIFERINAFTSLVNSRIEKDDMFALIMKLISKVCESSFEQLKIKFILQSDVCGPNFIGSLRNYLIELPYAQNKRANNLYWRDPNEFWKNLISFCDCIVSVAPSMALLKCRSLIDATTKICLEGLRDRHQYVLPGEYSTKLAQLRERLLATEKEDIEKKEKLQINADVYESEPPNNFRELSVVPHHDDLMDHKPFCRPNLVEGGYADVEHYLDVQFRLLREDCFGPLRDGIFQYMENPNAKKFDHIRVYRNVQFIGPYISKTKFGSVIQLEEKTVKRFKKINWAHSKRFIFGSLLLFIKDNCKNFVVATILERDVSMLNLGQIPVSLVDMAVTNTISKEDIYVMIESEVYFEPYYHVLKALQDEKFPEHLAMKDYIVHVNPFPDCPAYLNPNSIFTVETQDDPERKFRVLQEETWPSAKDLCLNDSQLEAYRLALTHEFAVIQGPPGTGKTYLGVKVAKTLLKNLSHEDIGCLMLVICYTNHALDQFLNALLDVTKSMVRIGGQSRDAAMEKINLNTLRRTCNNLQRNRLFNEQRHNLRSSVLAVKEESEKLEKLNKGLLVYDKVKSLALESEVIGLRYSQITNGDPLYYWLFESMPIVDFDAIVKEESIAEDFDETPNDVDEDIFARNEVDLDDVNIDEEGQGGKDIKMSFSLNEAESNLKKMVKGYLKSVFDQEKENLRATIVNLKSKIEYFKEMSVFRTRTIHRNMRELLNRNPDIIPPADRWAFYFDWANNITAVLAEKIKPLQKSLEDANMAYEEARMAIDLEILKKVKVVGMTTSGAARLRKLLQALKPPIVIVEEAAEVLEAHIITSLTKNCEHLILIGDHQQLRPSASNVRLARKFKIEISLFERMIMNNVHSRRLSVQHRMRPEIAELISPHIYKDLENHCSVEAFPKVRGVTTNLYFFSHNFKEHEEDDSSSKINYKEGDMVLRLANYVMQQGYDPADVTILSAYSGQMFYMRNQRNKYKYLAKVKITVLDNYQGEESKIIILSLVRNNSKNNIGFLANENRVCVALSRAREGFYIFGNMPMLCKEQLWKDISNTLDAQGALGNSLCLRCESHPTQYTEISCAEDFDKVPEGGCLLKCNYNLVPCGHPCPLICHGYDVGHSTTPCRRNCERKICELDHPCPLKCSVKCKPCKVMVNKILPCGHSMMMFCHLDPTDPIVKCNTHVPVTLPNCGHETRKPCHMDIKAVVCKVRCVYRVEPCGHECRRNCHVTDDPDHEKYVCDKPCAKAKKGCTADLVGNRGDHQCLKKCYESCDDCGIEVMKKRSTCKHSYRVPCCKNVDDIPCRQNCARVLPCGHYCRKKCHEPCGDCPIKVKKTIPECGHEVKTECSRAAGRELCRAACARELPCGHRCARPCAQPCDPKACRELIPRKFPSPCGHDTMLPCNLFNQMFSDQLPKTELLAWCQEPCNEILECGHLCGGSCSECRQGRLHAPCRQTCHQVNICGHECEEPCNQLCPPCKKRCEVKCSHTKCNKMCGAPCIPCPEPCDRRCQHGSCDRRCGEPCSRAPCGERCDKLLGCGHGCRGLCGEPCPDICRICRPDDFPKDFLGDDYEDDDRFVQLQDCNHVLEIENMENLMTGDSETVKIRTCPFCRKPIINTYRYKDLVNKMYRTEINPIKERVFGNAQQIRTKKLVVDEKLQQVTEQHELALKGCHDLRKALDQIKIIIKNQKKVSLVHLEMQCVYLNIINILGDCYKKYSEAKTGKLEEEFLTEISVISKVLSSNTQKISRQQQEDINNEIKRIDIIIQYSKILNHTAYTTTKNHPKVMEANQKAKNVVLGWNKFNQDEALEILKQLQDTVKVSGIVTKEERDLIVKAIGLKAGHWYKCPNGHFYCIGECGGAMQVGNCPDCGVKIGGQSHTLLANNSHAPEMDGSRFAAWSNEYNNMGNFQF